MRLEAGDNGFYQRDSVTGGGESRDRGSPSRGYWEGGGSQCGSVVGWGGACMGHGRGEDPEGGLELAPHGAAWPALRVGWLWGAGGESSPALGEPWGRCAAPHLAVRSRWRWCRREEEKLGAGPRARRRSFVSLQR